MDRLEWDSYSPEETFAIGKSIGGIPGIFAATLGMAMPPFVVIVLPKFAFSPDSMKELRASVEKKTGKEIAHA